MLSNQNPNSNSDKQSTPNQFSNFLARFYSNHVLANLVFGLVLVLGAIQYFSLPREKDPDINFNWIRVRTFLPGASAQDVEKLVTDPLEEAIENIQDIRFVSSESREGISDILVRFVTELDERTFDKRLSDLRREIQNKESELPEEAETPLITEITTANAFPSATIAILGQANDEYLRKQARDLKKDLLRFKKIDSIRTIGLHDPEILVEFDKDALIHFGLTPVDLAQTIQAHYKDVSAGTAPIGEQRWLIRWVGQAADLSYIKTIPIITVQGELALGEIAHITRTYERPTTLAKVNGRPAILFSVMKKAKVNTLELVDELNEFIEEKNNLSNTTGIRLVLLDDQTEVTKNALGVMQKNALIGLFLVLLTTWCFLGFKSASLISIGIPFILAGTFLVLSSLGQTLNISVLLGIVISLGMLVDDSVVVVEAIYIRLKKGMNKVSAVLDALQEVFGPVTTSVLTTMAAFAPLMLLPGILGKFMMVIPMVVVIALAISLIEAYWILPAHMMSMKIDFSKPSKIDKLRSDLIHRLRIAYVRRLIKVLQAPKKTLTVISVIVALAFTALFSGAIHTNFFASDPLRLFYVNVEMPPNSSLQSTLNQTQAVETQIRQFLKSEELRSISSYAGIMFTQTSPFTGDHYGQILVSLNPKTPKLRTVDDVMDSMRDTIESLAGPVNISFVRLAGGPPTSMPINIKVRGNQYQQIRQATNYLLDLLKTNPAIYSIQDDDSQGRYELVMQPNFDAIQRSGIDPNVLIRLVRLTVDGEIITHIQDEGEKVEIRLKAQAPGLSGIENYLDQTIYLPNDKTVPLRELVTFRSQPSPGNIRHYNFKRTITVEADLNKDKMDTVAVNKWVQKNWKTVESQFPNVSLEFSGELDDIQESLDEIPFLFLLGVGIIYLILGTQFRSYWQPLMILVTIPLAFTGVIFGLLITQTPLSLYTLYGIVALSGITVNAAIVMISAANDRLKAGYSVIQATLYAARRRLIPILITSLTTIAGLFSLATGLGGKSLLWGPVATSIVWGLSVSTILTLFVIPVLYYLAMNRSKSSLINIPQSS